MLAQPRDQSMRRDLLCVLSVWPLPIKGRPCARQLSMHITACSMLRNTHCYRQSFSILLLFDLTASLAARISCNQRSLECRTAVSLNLVVSNCFISRFGNSQRPCKIRRAYRAPLLSLQRRISQVTGSRTSGSTMIPAHKPSSVMQQATVSICQQCTLLHFILIDLQTGSAPDPFQLEAERLQVRIFIQFLLWHVGLDWPK